MASIWARRAVTLPVYFALFSLAAASAPVALPIALVTDVFTGRAKVLPRTRALLFFGVYLTCEVFGVVGSFLLWARGHAHNVEPHFALQRAFTGALFRGAVRLFSMKVNVQGLDGVGAGPLLLLVRHSSTADTVLTAALVINPLELHARYVIKRELLWDPCLDIVGRRLPNAFIDRTVAKGSEVGALARDLDARSAVLIYPEGTRFSPEKLAAAGERGVGFREVLPPRIGGVIALLEAAPGVDVVFVEHTGFEGAATFRRFWSGALVRQTIRVRLRRVAPPRPEDREAWLMDQWREVDRWISAAAAAE